MDSNQIPGGDAVQGIWRFPHAVSDWMWIEPQILFEFTFNHRYEKGMFVIAEKSVMFCQAYR